MIDLFTILLYSLNKDIHLFHIPRLFSFACSYVGGKELLTVEGPIPQVNPMLDFLHSALRPVVNDGFVRIQSVQPTFPLRFRKFKSDLYAALSPMITVLLIVKVEIKCRALIFNAKSSIKVLPMIFVGQIETNQFIGRSYQLRTRANEHFNTTLRLIMKLIRFFMRILYILFQPINPTLTKSHQHFIS